MNTNSKNTVFKVIRYVIMSLVLLYLIPQLFFKQEMSQILPSFMPTYYDLCPFGITDSFLSFLALFHENTATLAFGVLTGFIILYIITFFFGRIFCSFICPLGTIQEFLGKFGDFLFKKVFKCNKPKINKVADELLRYCKYALLLSAIIIAVAQGKILFALLQDELPIFQLFNPWLAVQYLDVPSILFGSYLVSFISMIILLVASIIFDRFFCRYFCIAGAMYSFISAISIFKFKSTDNKVIEDNGAIQSEELSDESIINETISEDIEINTEETETESGDENVTENIVDADTETDESESEIETLACERDSEDLYSCTEDAEKVCDESESNQVDETIENTDSELNEAETYEVITEQQCCECECCASKCKDVINCPVHAINDDETIQKDECISCGKCAYDTRALHFFNIKVPTATILLPVLILLASFSFIHINRNGASDIPHQSTLTESAKEIGMSTEEYITTIGYDDETITGATTQSDIYEKILDYPIEKTLKLLNLPSVDEIIKMYNLPEDTAKDLTFRQYRDMATLEIVAQVGDLNVGGMTVEDYIDYYSLPSDAKGTDTFGKYAAQIEAANKEMIIDDLYSNYTSCCDDHTKFNTQTQAQ